MALVCADVAAPANAFAEKARQSDGQQEKKGKDRAAGQSEQKKEDGKEKETEGGKKSADKEDSAASDPYKITRIDENGRDYRMCPVCGSNMYRQDHTWTCENCGYSYEE